MGYRDYSELPMELFTRLSDPVHLNDDQLRRRLKQGQGEPIYRLEQLERIYNDMTLEPLIKLEFDRFHTLRSRKHHQPR